MTEVTHKHADFDEQRECKFTESRKRERRATEEDIRIGWQVPCHLFEGETGESLCGRSGVRESISPNETRKVTSPIQYPLKYLGSKEEVVQFANGICGHCLRLYYRRHGNLGPAFYLDLYRDLIMNADESDALCFCHNCGSTVDPNSCSSALFNGEYHTYICDECNLRNFVGIVEGIERDNGPGSTTSGLLNTLRSTLSDVEDRDR